MNGEVYVKSLTITEVKKLFHVPHFTFRSTKFPVCDEDYPDKYRIKLITF
jgi:hypothetical protein